MGMKSLVDGSSPDLEMPLRAAADEMHQEALLLLLYYLLLPAIAHSGSAVLELSRGLPTLSPLQASHMTFQTFTATRISSQALTSY